MDIKIPMRPASTFTEQINIKVKPELKEKYKFLKENGVDMAELSRSTLEPVIERTYLAFKP